MNRKIDLIVIHGTASGNLQSVLDTYRSNPAVSTQYIIDLSGDVVQYKPDEYLCYHAGAKYRSISQRSIGIELVNWNWLKLVDGKFYSWVNTPVSPDQVFTAKSPWRGYRYFHKITQLQHQSLTQLLQTLTDKFSIQKKLIRSDNSNPVGICFHSTFNAIKFDFHPELIPPIKLK